MEKILYGLKSSEYEHPEDREFLKELQSIPAFAPLTKTLLDWSYLKWATVALKGSDFLVTKDSCPDLYKTVEDTARVLDLDNVPEVYTEWGYYVNAYTTGYDNSNLLVLYSGSVDLLSENELKFVIGHEMGHIKGQHVLYHVMAENINEIISSNFLKIGVALTLMRWYRMSEFTADRAGLLACQDINVAIDAIRKMAGVPRKYFDSYNRDAFLKQAKDFQESTKDSVKKLIKNISILGSSHPWTIMRAAELLKWYESGEYDRILNSHQAKFCPIHKDFVPNDAQICPVCGYKF